MPVLFQFVIKRYFNSIDYKKRFIFRFARDSYTEVNALSDSLMP